QGLRVGLITNDQSSGLVDTSLLRSQGYSVEEIAGGCFCCRFDSLSEAAERLEADTRPEVFIAEPVGSCTDLVATVSYPLRRIYGERFTVAPLSVLVDPVRAERVLGLGIGRSFSKKVIYVYEKQLEEADLIIVNKSDSLPADRAQALVKALENRFPNAEVMCCSALTGDGLQPWFDRVLETECVLQPTMTVDYQLYAEGEALLGWLNMTARLQAAHNFDANQLLLDLSTRLKNDLQERDLEIAHLKMTLDSKDAGGQLAALSLTRNDEEIDLREALIDGVHEGQLILNLRAEADPGLLRELCGAALDSLRGGEAKLELTIEHSEHFRPSPPVPTHRQVISATASDGGGEA
ncbi:MAG: G3E family GTPase, partial [Planctomycetota bacterium]